MAGLAGRSKGTSGGGMLIFLDFDGVMHANYNDPPFSRAALLWKILRALPEARVVFSTSWRDNYAFDRMVNLTTRNGGNDLAHRFIGNTPNLEAEGRYGRRDLEIQSWLTTNNHTGAWLALDDMAELFTRDHPNLYLVDGNTGLTKADVKKIIEKLRERTS